MSTSLALDPAAVSVDARPVHVHVEQVLNR